MNLDMEFILSICLGIGLAAACGFRVFVPLLGASLAGWSGQVNLAEGWEWIGSWPAVACLATATVLEIGAYYVPWLDNLLDSIATPAAVVAGTIAAGSLVTDVSPLMRWSLALIAGGGAAATVQTGTVALRGVSTASTGGLANPLFSTVETVLSGILTVLAIVVPLICVALLVSLAMLLTLWWARRRRRPLATVDSRG